MCEVARSNPGGKNQAPLKTAQKQFTLFPMKTIVRPVHVIPANAGIHLAAPNSWIPGMAAKKKAAMPGMTKV